MWEDNAHLTYLFHPTHIVWIWQISVGPPPPIVLASSHHLWPLPWNSWCSRDAGISNDDSQCTVGARLISGMLKLGLHGHHGSGKGDVAQPQPIHWFFEEFTHSQREMCWSTTLLKWHLLHNPIVARLWYNIIPHLTHVKLRTVPSKKIWSKVELQVPHGLLWWSFNESSNHNKGHRSGYWLTTLRRILHIPLHKHTLSHTERVALHRHGFLNLC